MRTTGREHVLAKYRLVERENPGSNQYIAFNQALERIQSTGSTELMSLPFRLLHKVHDRAKLSIVVFPPCFSARIWSTW